MKEAFQVKLRELKEKAELGPSTEEELSEEESEVAPEETFTDGPFTDGPFTDEFELPSTSDAITDQLKPTEMLSTPTTEEPPTEYIDGDWNQEVVNDEQQTGEESEEEDGEDEVIPEGPIEEEEAAASEEESSQINVFSRMMSERKRHMLKRGKAMKSKLKNALKKWFNKRREDN